MYTLVIFHVRDDKIPITEDCHYHCWGDDGPEGLLGLKEYVQEPYQTPFESVPAAPLGIGLGLGLEESFQKPY